MHDITADLQTFYYQNVCLGSDRRKDLAAKRDLNLTRLNGGLDDLAAESGFARPHPLTYYNQGSYAMHTLNQDPGGNNDFDIDVGLIFAKDDLPSDPLKARQRIADALAQRCTNFTQEPTAKKNAVRVAYADGYHIDFAVYRKYQDWLGNDIIEHASTEWKPRDPMAINNWFRDCVANKSPKAMPSLGYYPIVEEQQFRRIVRFIKWFCRSRPSWSLPGGLIVSALVAEVYVSNSDRDDRSLYDTLVALASRLKTNTSVFNPVSGNEFTENGEVERQVERLRDQCAAAVAKLSPLFESDCTRKRARSAWDWVFNHSFWADQEAVQKAALDEATVSLAALPFYVQLKCELASREGGPIYREYASGAAVLQKNVHLKFSITGTNVPEPYSVIWEIRNTGDEAAADDALQPSAAATADRVRWTSTAYKGNHHMVCKIVKNGVVVANTKHLVRIAPGRWWRR